MKYIYTLLLSVSLLVLTTACEEETKTPTKSTASVNPVDSYVDSRLNAYDMAKDTVKESNKRVEKQNKILEDLNK